MTRPACTRLWGPVSEERARAIGALSAATSVLIKPDEVDENIEAAVAGLLPLHVLPSLSDSAESLRVRLSESDFLHEAWVLRDGHGRRGYIRLNVTSYPQPRRVRWSKEIISEHVDSSADRIVGCVAYPHYYHRSPLDQTCEVMPAAVEQLVAWAHELAKPYLPLRLHASSPNACELNLYHTAFGGHIGRHRDNFTSKDLCNYLHTRDPSIAYNTENAQEAYTWVLIWTVGNAPMDMVLSFPRHAALAHDRSKYDGRRPEFTIRLSHGTLFIFSPLDDLFFCHEAHFPDEVLREKGATGYRASFVMRWLSVERATKLFHVNGERHAMLKVDEGMKLAEADRVRTRQRERAKKRRWE
jgi:hypothetical protein